MRGIEHTPSTIQLRGKTSDGGDDGHQRDPEDDTIDDPGEYGHRHRRSCLIPAQSTEALGRRWLEHDLHLGVPISLTTRVSTSLRADVVDRLLARWRLTLLLTLPMTRGT